MLKLAESSGIIVYENGNNLYITKKPAQWTSTFLFVTGLIAFILLVNGFLQLFILEIPQVSSTLGIVLLGLGILAAFIFWRVLAYRKKISTIPVDELNCICIIDLAANNLLNGQQHILAPLSTVQLHRKMQITSSSPSLLLKWNNNSLILVEGNPFSGGIAAVEKALISKGIKKE